MFITTTPTSDINPISGASFPTSGVDPLLRDGPWDYKAMSKLVKEVEMPFPLMFVDLSILNENIGRVRDVAESHGKKIRLATKSVRCRTLINYIQKKLGDSANGVMCYSMPEAHFLASNGQNNILMGYPIAQDSDIELAWKLTQSGTDFTLMVDCVKHIDILSKYWKTHKNSTSIPFRVCVEIDVSYRTFGIHIGTQRSPLRTMDGFREFLSLAKEMEGIKVIGIMGYEAQIAGVPDAVPGHDLMNLVIRGVKKLSAPDVAKKRTEAVEIANGMGMPLSLVNGGGTGSIRTTGRDSSVTEITVGSGFLQSDLFNHYHGNQNIPAICFALLIERIPERGVVTCKSGGFVASGSPGWGKLPTPFLPRGLKLLRDEGAGEVQTPLRIDKRLIPVLQIREPVFFLPAKAGEISEMFKRYILLRDGKIQRIVETYRGNDMEFR